MNFEDPPLKTRLDEIKEIISEISLPFSSLLNFVDQQKIIFTNPNEPYSDDQSKKIINTIIYLSQFVSSKIKNDLDKCKTSLEKTFIVDKYFGLDFLERECTDFILDMDIIFEEILNNSNFTIESDGKILTINGEDTAFLCSKNFSKISWQECMKMRNRQNRAIINTIKNIFTKEYDNVMLEVLIKHFNFFVFFKDQ